MCYLLPRDSERKSTDHIALNLIPIRGKMTSSLRFYSDQGGGGSHLNMASNIMSSEDP